MGINLKQNCTETLQVRRQENIDQANTNQIKSDRVISSSDEINFKRPNMLKDTEVHSLMITKIMYALSKSRKIFKYE